MQINLSTQESRVPVTIMQLNGDLDASNYADVITEAQRVYDAGARDLVIDLSKVPYVSSAGLMSLHAVALIMAGQSQLNENKRPSFRSINSGNESIVRQHVKLLNPQIAVEQVLDMVGLKQFLDIHTNLEAAIQSF